MTQAQKPQKLKKRSGYQPTKPQVFLQFKRVWDALEQLADEDPTLGDIPTEEEKEVPAK